MGDFRPGYGKQERDGKRWQEFYLFCCSEKRVTGPALHAGKANWLQEKERGQMHDSGKDLGRLFSVLGRRC